MCITVSQAVLSKVQENGKCVCAHTFVRLFVYGIPINVELIHALECLIHYSIRQIGKLFRFIIISDYEHLE